MNKVSLLLLTGLITLSGCTSVNNFGNSLADKATRFATEQYIGKSYREVASKRDFSLERKLIIGEQLGRRILDNGNSVYYHELRQESPSTANVLGGAISFGDKAVRYDYYAYLVSEQDIILDFAHKRANKKISHFGLNGDLLSTEFEGEETADNDLEQVDAFITSKGKSISSWN